MITGRHPLGYVVQIDGPQILLNLHESTRGHAAGHADGVSTVGQPGDLIGVEGGPDIIVVRVLSIAFAEPREMHARGMPGRVAPAVPLRQLKGCVIGFIARRDRRLAFTAQEWRLPVLGAAAFPLSEQEVLATLDGKPGAGERLLLGKDARSGLLPFSVGVDDLLGRHLAVLGGTGQGKTHFVAALLQALARAPEARIVVFDVNGEYAPAFSQLGERLKVTRLGGEGGLRLPYQALGRHGLSRILLPSERAQMPALRFALEHLPFVWADEEGAGLIGGRKVFFDDCRPGDASDAFEAMRQLKSRKAKPADRWPHISALSCLAAEWYATRQEKGAAKRDSFPYSHIHSLVNRVRGLIEDERFREVVNVEGGDPVLWPLSMEAEGHSLVRQVFGGQRASETPWSVHVVDLSRLAQDLMPFVLGSFLELYAAELFQRGPGNTHPTLLVLEEAHHYLRQLPGDAETGQHALAYERLAKEGRKFGVSLLVSTQRPSEVSPTVLAQCGTWAVFRLSNEVDQRSVTAAAESAATNVARQISGLARGEAVFFGGAVPVATRVAVVRPLPEPRSSDPGFEQSWRVTGSAEGQGVLG